MITAGAILLRIRNVSEKVAQNIETHFMFRMFFRNSCHVRDNVEKSGTAGQATDDNMAHAHCMLDT